MWVETVLALEKDILVGNKLDAWMERGKEKMKHVVEEQSEAAKDWFSNSLDAAHDFVQSIVQEMSTGNNSVVLNLHDSSPFLHAYFFVCFRPLSWCDRNLFSTASAH